MKSPYEDDYSETKEDITGAIQNLATQMEQIRLELKKANESTQWELRKANWRLTLLCSRGGATWCSTPDDDWKDD